MQLPPRLKLAFATVFGVATLQVFIIQQEVNKMTGHFGNHYFAYLCSYARCSYSSSWSHDSHDFHLVASSRAQASPKRSQTSINLYFR